MGWVPLDRTNEASAALELFVKNPYFKGVRNLTHDYTNPKYESDDKWILRPEVLKTLALVESARVSFGLCGGKFRTHFYCADSC